MAGLKKKQLKSTGIQCILTNKSISNTDPRNGVKTISKFSIECITELIESIKLLSKVKHSDGSQQESYTDVINELMQYMIDMVIWLKNGLILKNYRNIVKQIYLFFNTEFWRHITESAVIVLNTVGKFVKLDVNVTDETTKISLIPYMGNI